MKMLPKLDERLSVLAGLVRPGSRTADVGTDHGLLITWLAASGRIPCGFACDINRKPLEKARACLRAYGVQEKVGLLLCDGLAGIQDGACDDIVIAGMGGDLILDIVSHTPWTRNPRLRFILQPMTKAHRLRGGLCAEGFAIEEEHAVISKGFPYTAMVVRYTGQPEAAGPAFSWGGLLARQQGEAARAYIDKVCRLLREKTDGMRRGGAASKELAEYEEALAELLQVPAGPGSQEGAYRVTVQNVYEAIDKAAAFSLALDFDNPGLLVGDPQEAVKSAVVALDVTEEVIQEAVSRGANLIVTHHPVIFHPMRRVTADTLVYRLIREGISVISAHTNLDIAAGGVNDILAGLLELQDAGPAGTENLMRVGTLKRGMTPPEFAYYVKQKLDLPALRYCDGGRAIERVAVVGGSGGSMLEEAALAGCEAFVTGDVKHDVMLDAAHRQITLLDAGHFGTETHVLGYLMDLVRTAAGEGVPVCIARSNQDPAVTI